MLYDGAIRMLRQSAEAMRRGDCERTRQRMRPAEAIIDELNNSLDMSQGEIAVQLRALYLYCKRVLIRANIETDPTGIDEVVKLLAELREAWNEIQQTAEAASAA